MAKKEGYEATQVSVGLTPRQREAIEKRLREKQKDDPYVRRADVIREIIDKGLNVG